jgi:uridine phosphorylase
MSIPESELIINPDGSIYHLGLRPGEVSDLILTVGDPDRVSVVSRHFDSVEITRRRREFVTHTGYVGKQRVTVISSGIGTDNVEIVMTELDALFNIDFTTRTPVLNPTSLRFIRLGTSGSLRRELPVDSLVASRSAIGLDTLMQFYNLPQSDEQCAVARALGEALNLGFTPYLADASPELVGSFSVDFLSSNTLTCPGFYAPQGRTLRLTPRTDFYLEKLIQFDTNGYSVGNFEMETAGYYVLSNLLNHKFLSLNAIMANRVTGEFSRQGEKTIDRLITMVLERL